MRPVINRFAYPELVGKVPRGIAEEVGYTHLGAVLGTQIRWHIGLLATDAVRKEESDQWS